MKKIVSLNQSAIYLRVAIGEGNIPRLMVFQNSQIQIWDYEQMIHEWKPNNATIVDACYSAKAEYIYVILSNNYLYILSPKLTNLYCLRLNEVLTTLAANPVSVSQIAVGTEQGHIYMLDIPPPK